MITPSIFSCVGLACRSALFSIALTIVVFHTIIAGESQQPINLELGSAHPGTGTTKILPGTSVSVVANQLARMSEHSRIVIVRAGKPIVIGARSGKEAWTQPVEDGDFVFCNEPAEALIEWLSAHPNEQISNSQLLAFGQKETALITSAPPLSNAEHNVANLGTDERKEIVPVTVEHSNATPQIPSDESTSSTTRAIIVVLIVAAIGLLWLLVKKRQ